MGANDDKGRTPLRFAARYGHRAVAELLIAKGADVNAKATLGNTPLRGAAGLGEEDNGHESPLLYPPGHMGETRFPGENILFSFTHH